MQLSRRTVLSAGLGLAAVAGLGVAGPAAAAPDSAAWHDGAAAVYTQTNAVDGNAILAFARHRSGRLVQIGAAPTGGLGTGAGLGSQGAVTLTPGGRHLLAVNAGSDSVTAFAVGRERRLHRLGTAGSGGDQPVSVTAHGRLVYVVNAGATPAVRGFRLDRHGLHPIPGSIRRLPAGAAGPAQIGFTPDGRRLVVTLKASNRIDTLAVDALGRPGAVVSTPSAGTTPFGFSFDARGNVLVSNAAGGAAGASTVTSYRIRRDGRLGVLTGPVATGESAACWLVLTPDGRHAYTTNPASSTVSSLRVHHGRLAVTAGAAARTGAGPIDAGFAPSGRTLYVLAGAGRAIEAFGVDRHTGALTPRDTVGDLPAGLVGLAVA